MNSEFKNWLDRATLGLPSEIQPQIRAELTEHYHAALTDAQRSGQTSDAAHEQVLAELGDADVTARGLRRAHLHLHRHLAAGIMLALVLCWFLVNDKALIPNAYVSGSLRIMTSASMFTLFLSGLWLLRDFFTRQLGLAALRLPLNLQLLGWGLSIFPFLRAVLLAHITPLNELLMTDYPLVQHRLFQFMEVINFASMLLICLGLMLMARRLTRIRAHLYGFGRLLRWVAFMGGLIFAYASMGQIMSIMGVNFVVSSAPDAPTQIGLIGRTQPMESIVWLSSGINWLDGLAVAAWVCQASMLGVLAALFIRTYLQNTYWLKPRSST